MQIHTFRLYHTLFALSTNAARQKEPPIARRFKSFGSLHPSSAAFIKGGVAAVEVFGVKVILRDAEGIGETIKGEWILRYPFFLNFPFDIQTVF